MFEVEYTSATLSSKQADRKLENIPEYGTKEEFNSFYEFCDKWQERGWRLTAFADDTSGYNVVWKLVKTNSTLTVVFDLTALSPAKQVRCMMCDQHIAEGSSLYFWDFSKNSAVPGPAEEFFEEDTCPVRLEKLPYLSFPVIRYNRSKYVLEELFEYRDEIYEKKILYYICFVPNVYTDDFTSVNVDKTFPLLSKPEGILTEINGNHKTVVQYWDITEIDCPKGWKLAKVRQAKDPDYLHILKIIK